MNNNQHVLITHIHNKMSFLTVFYIFMYFVRIAQVGFSMYLLTPLYQHEMMGMYIAYGSWILVLVLQVLLILLTILNYIDDIRNVLWGLNMIHGCGIFAIILSIYLQKNLSINPTFVSIGIVFFGIASLENFIFTCFYLHHKYIEHRQNGILQRKINDLLTIDSNNAYNERECSICIVEYNQNDVKSSLPCGHTFHEPCIKKWIAIESSCPTCRKLYV